MDDCALAEGRLPVRRSTTLQRRDPAPDHTFISEAAEEVKRRPGSG